MVWLTYFFLIDLCISNACWNLNYSLFYLLKECSFIGFLLSTFFLGYKAGIQYVLIIFFKEKLCFKPEVYLLLMDKPSSPASSHALVTWTRQLLSSLTLRVSSALSSLPPWSSSLETPLHLLPVYSSSHHFRSKLSGMKRSPGQRFIPGLSHNMGQGLVCQYRNKTGKKNLHWE